MRFVPQFRRHFREPLILPRRCPCGHENVRKGQCIGPACFAAAPKTLKREVFSKDVEVARAAWQALQDFAKGNAVRPGQRNADLTTEAQGHREESPDVPRSALRTSR